MTAQEVERIVFEGSEYGLATTPLEALLATAPRPPKFRSISTARWRGYTASWEIDDAGRLLLAAIDAADVMDAVALAGLRGWVGLSKVSRRGRAMVAQHVGFARRPLPVGVKPARPLPARPLRRWLTAGDSIVVGVLDRVACEWRASEPAVVLERDGVAIELEVAEVQWIDPDEQVALADLLQVGVEFPDVFLAGEPAWVRMVAPAFPFVRVEGSNFPKSPFRPIEPVVAYQRVRDDLARLPLEDYAAFLLKGSRPFSIDDVVPGGTLPVFAEWYSGELRIVAGAALSHRNRGFDRWWDDEIVLQVRSGTVVARDDGQSLAGSEPKRPSS